VPVNCTVLGAFVVQQVRGITVCRMPSKSTDRRTDHAENGSSLLCETAPCQVLLLLLLLLLMLLICDDEYDDEYSGVHVRD
jgi:hypothetical protein